jgi:hypothetical protein
LSWRTCDRFEAQQGGDDNSETSGLCMFCDILLPRFHLCQWSVTSSIILLFGLRNRKGVDVINHI